MDDDNDDLKSTILNTNSQSNKCLQIFKMLNTTTTMHCKSSDLRKLQSKDMVPHLRRNCFNNL